MRHIFMTIALSFVSGAALAAPMLEIKGLRPAEGCLHDAKTVTDRLVMCPIGGVRIRIWCPNGKVFDRDGPDLGVAVARSVCEMPQLP
jgi:hypothetical protein